MLKQREVLDLNTGFPENDGCRVKKHYIQKSHVGIFFLRRRDIDGAVDAKNIGMKEIDMLLVNLSPFEATIETAQIAIFNGD